MITIYADNEDALEIITNRIKRFQNDREYQELYIEYFEQLLNTNILTEIDIGRDIDNFVINETLIYDKNELTYNEIDKDSDRILYQNHGLFLINARN